MSQPLKPIIEIIAVDQVTGKLSSTKWWSNVAAAILCVAFAHQVWDSTASTELYLVFGGLLLGNKTLRTYLDKRGEARKEPFPSLNNDNR